MAFQADEDGLFSSGWFWLAVTLVMIVPVVLLSIAISKLPAVQDLTGDLEISPVSATDAAQAL